MTVLVPSCVIAAGMVLASAALAQTVTFSEVAIGSLPAPFETALTGDGLIGFWAVVQDDTAQGGRALEQRTPDPTDYRLSRRCEQFCNVRNEFYFRHVGSKIGHRLFL